MMKSLSTIEPLLKVVEVRNQKGEFIGTEIHIFEKVYMIDATSVNKDYTIRHNGFVANIGEEFTYSIVSEIKLK